MALYRCGGGAGELTPLTPSNSDPVAISSGGKYEATAAGYAIESYSSVGVISQYGTQLSNRNIYKLVRPSAYLFSTKNPVLAPSQVAVALVKNTTYPYTIDNIECHYIVTSVFRVNGTTARGGSWYIKGLIQGGSQTVPTCVALSVDSDADMTVAVEYNVTINKYVINCTGTNATYSKEVRIIKLNNIV